MYVAEAINEELIAGHFGHIGLCQLCKNVSHTETVLYEEVYILTRPHTGMRLQSEGREGRPEIRCLPSIPPG